MDLELDETQRILKSAVREFFEKEWSLKYTRVAERGTFPTEAWERLGALGLLQPASALNGVGLVEQCLIAEEMGRALFPSAFVDTVVACGWLLGQFGSDFHKQTLVPEIVRGGLLLTTGFVGPDGAWGTKGVVDQAADEAGGFRLVGSRVLVSNADLARYLVWPARTTADGMTLFLVDLDDAGITRRALSNIAGEPLFAVSTNGVFVPHKQVIGAVGDGGRLLEETLRRAAIVQCALMAGGAERVLEMTLGYAKLRHQFNQPIGRFQLVQSLCVDIAADAHRMQLFARQAAWAVDAGASAEREAALAAAFAAQAISRVVRAAHEVHAGMGFMSDYDLQLFTRRAKHWESTYGDSDQHLERVAAVMTGSAA